MSRPQPQKLMVISCVRLEMKALETMAQKEFVGIHEQEDKEVEIEKRTLGECIFAALVVLPVLQICPLLL